MLRILLTLHQIEIGGVCHVVTSAAADARRISDYEPCAMPSVWLTVSEVLECTDHGCID